MRLLGLTRYTTSTLRSTAMLGPSHHPSAGQRPHVPPQTFQRQHPSTSGVRAMWSLWNILLVIAR